MAEHVTGFQTKDGVKKYDYLHLANKPDSFSSALKGSAAGISIQIDDVSPIKHEISCRIKSKNLVPFPYYSTEGTVEGVTYTIYDDGKVAISGESTKGTNFNFAYNQRLEPGTYTISGAGTIIGLNFCVYDVGRSKSLCVLNAGRSSATFTVTETVEKAMFYLNTSLGGQKMSGYIYPQIEKGSEATSYTPYVNPASAAVICNEKSYPAGSDGVVEGVISSSPTMTFTTDTENTVVDIEYQRDIDKAIKEIEQILSPARIVYINILASAWKGSNSLYSQVVTVPGATKNSQVDLTPSIDQLVIFYNKNLTFVTENVNGVVTVYAIGQKPQSDYTIQATVTEVNR